MFIARHGLALSDVRTSRFVGVFWRVAKPNSRLSMATPYVGATNWTYPTEEAAALTANATGNDRYPFFERIAS